MANHASAKKRNRQTLKRTERNNYARATLRTLVRQTKQAAEAGEEQKAAEVFTKAMRAADKAAIHGVLHKKNCC